MDQKTLSAILLVLAGAVSTAYRLHRRGRKAEQFRIRGTREARRRALISARVPRERDGRSFLADAGRERAKTME